jgi:hypothetical protein
MFNVHDMKQGDQIDAEAEIQCTLMYQLWGENGQPSQVPKEREQYFRAPPTGSY